MTDTDDKRVTELDDLAWEIPHSLNRRPALFEAALADNTARIDGVGRATTTLRTDLRGGVTPAARRAGPAARRTRRAAQRDRTEARRGPPAITETVILVERCRIAGF